MDKEIKPNKEYTIVIPQQECGLDFCQTSATLRDADGLEFTIRNQSKDKKIAVRILGNGKIEVQKYPEPTWEKLK